MSKTVNSDQALWLQVIPSPWLIWTISDGVRLEMVERYTEIRGEKVLQFKIQGEL